MLLNDEISLKLRAVIGGHPQDVVDAIAEMVSAPVLDTDGNYLVIGRKYLLGSNPVRITKIEFGSGNIMDTYYRVSFLNHELDDRRVTIDGKHTKQGTVYQSQFKPVSKE
jgi:hypothetical protein